MWASLQLVVGKGDLPGIALEVHEQTIPGTRLGGLVYEVAPHAGAFGSVVFRGGEIRAALGPRVGLTLPRGGEVTIGHSEAASAAGSVGLALSTGGPPALHLGGGLRVRAASFPRYAYQPDATLSVALQLTDTALGDPAPTELLFGPAVSLVPTRAWSSGSVVHDEAD